MLTSLLAYLSARPIEARAEGTASRYKTGPAARKTPYIPVYTLTDSGGPRLEAPAREKNLGGFHPHKPHPSMPAGRSTGQHNPFTLDWETVPEFGQK